MSITIRFIFDNYDQYYKINKIYKHYHHSYRFSIKDGYEGIYFTFPKHTAYKYFCLLTNDFITLLGEDAVTTQSYENKKEEKKEEDDGE